MFTSSRVCMRLEENLKGWRTVGVRKRKCRVMKMVHLPDEPGMADIYRRRSPLFHATASRCRCWCVRTSGCFSFGSDVLDRLTHGVECADAPGSSGSCRAAGTVAGNASVAHGGAAVSTRLMREKTTDPVARTRISLRWKRR